MSDLQTFPPKKGKKKQKFLRNWVSKWVVKKRCFLIVTEPFVRRAQKRRVRFYQIEGLLWWISFWTPRWQRTSPAPRHEKDYSRSPPGSNNDILGLTARYLYQLFLSQNTAFEQIFEYLWEFKKKLPVYLGYFLEISKFLRDTSWRQEKSQKLWVILYLKKKKKLLRKRSVF